jgi:hypothetical protein
MPLTEPAAVYRLFEEHFARYVREYEDSGQHMVRYYACRSIPV